MYNNNK